MSNLDLTPIFIQILRLDLLKYLQIATDFKKVHDLNPKCRNSFNQIVLGSDVKFIHAALILDEELKFPQFCIKCNVGMLMYWTTNTDWIRRPSSLRIFANLRKLVLGIDILADLLPLCPNVVSIRTNYYSYWSNFSKNQKITYPQVKKLKCALRTHDDFCSDVFPNLTKLNIRRSCGNKITPIFNESFPHNLLRLQMEDCYPICFPENLIELQICIRSVESISLPELPSSLYLVKLSGPISYEHKWPSNLKHLYLKGKPCLKQRIPENLFVLKLFLNYTFTDKILMPQRVKYLVLNKKLSLPNVDGCSIEILVFKSIYLRKFKICLEEEDNLGCKMVTSETVFTADEFIYAHGNCCTSTYNNFNFKHIIFIHKNHCTGDSIKIFAKIQPKVNYYKLLR
jgi:hypothetical protein